MNDYNDGVATERQIRAGAITVDQIHAINVSAAVVWLQLFDALAADVTPGTTVPTNEYPIPTQGDTNGAGFTSSLVHDYSTGLTMFISTAKGGGTAAGADEAIVNLHYR